MFSRFVCYNVLIRVVKVGTKREESTWKATWMRGALECDQSGGIADGSASGAVEIAGFELDFHW